MKNIYSDLPFAFSKFLFNVLLSFQFFQTENSVYYIIKFALYFIN